MVTRQIPVRPAAAGLALGPPIVVGTTEIADDAPTVCSIAEAGGKDEAEILEACAMVAESPSPLTAIDRHVEQAQTPVAEVAAVFATMEDEYLARRADDVDGVGPEVVATLTGTVIAGANLPEDAVVCADDLTPADTAQIDALVAALQDGQLRAMSPMVASIADLDAGLHHLSARRRHRRRPTCSEDHVRDPFGRPTSATPGRALRVLLDRHARSRAVHLRRRGAAGGLGREGVLRRAGGPSVGHRGRA